MTDTQEHTLSFNADFVRIAQLARSIVSEERGGLLNGNMAKAIRLLTEGFEDMPYELAHQIVTGKMDPDELVRQRTAAMFAQMKAHQAKIERELREATLVEEALF